MEKYVVDEKYQKYKICLLNMTHDGITHKIIDFSPCIWFSCRDVSYQKKPLPLNITWIEKFNQVDYQKW